MKIYLVRHGQTDWNKEQKLQGQKDIPMNDEGIRQMNELADKLAVFGIQADVIISSPLERAKESAQIIADRIGYTEAITIDANFLERNFGSLEGVRWNPELNLEDPKYQVESVSDLCDRAKKALSKYTFADDMNVMIVSGHIDIDLDVEKLKSTGGRATYAEIKDYVKEKYGFSIASSFIAQVRSEW